MKGRVKIVGKDLSTTNSEIEEIELGEMEMVLFPSNYYHSIEALEDSQCIVLTSKSRVGSEYEDDTFRINDIQAYSP